MAKKHSDRVPKNVPIIKVRQQWTTKCGTTCTGQGYDGEKRYPPCGPTPPSSAPADNTCGLPDCVEVPTCRCRCSCAIKELLRERAQAPASRGTTPNETFYTSQEQIPQVHVAQILTLEPRNPTIHFRRWPFEVIKRERRRNIPCRPPRYAHAVLEDMLPLPPCPPGHQAVFYVNPNGVRDFWR